MATAELATGVLSLRASPVVAVAETVIELTPGSIAEPLIGLVGQADKPLLVSGVLLALVVLGGVAGLLARRRRAVATALLVALAVLGVLASVTRTGATGLDALPALIGAGVAIALLWWLAPAAGDRPAAAPVPVPSMAQPGEAAASPFDRRSFLLRAAAVGIGAVLVAGAGRQLGRGRAAIEAARVDLRSRLQHRLHKVAVPPGVDEGPSGVAPWVTPVGDFYRIDTSLTPPLLTPDNWRLRVHGMVDKELELTYTDLLERRLVDSWVTLCCVSNEVGGPLISNARWTGVRIDDLLAAAGPQAGADAVLSRSVDGWTCSTPLAALTDGRDALLAVAMNGEALPVEHGFPVRMVVPGLYGYVSATKWVVDMEVTRFARISAYWTDRGWSEQAPVKTSSRIDVPDTGANVSAGSVAVGGVAWAQHRGIDAVEVRVDDGPWHRATLAAEPTIDSWRQWHWRWSAEAGDHTLAVRAVDGDGTVQTGAVTGVLPDGATGYHTVSVRVA
jgi:DMSO/TMAO reductase YedYZ molybdopterin-dependent catalytic subunit